MYRLLIAVEVLDFVQALPRREQVRLWARFRQLGETPRRFSDFTTDTPGGRSLDVNVLGKYAIRYWEDGADQHVKILHIDLADI